MRVYTPIQPGLEGVEVLKPFALPTHTDGVPLLEQAPMVGGKASTDTGYGYVNPVSGWTSCFEVSGTPLVKAQTDSIVLRTTSTDGTGTIDTDLDLGWFLLPAAAAGDTLTNSTSISLSTTAGDLRIGRTAANRVLVQRNGYRLDGGVTTFQCSVFHEKHGGGLIGRRLTALEASVSRRTRQIVLAQHSRTRPAAPVAGQVSYDGTTVTVTNPSWIVVGDGTPPGITGHELWKAIGSARYDDTTESWVIGEWVVVQHGDAFQIEYATLETGPWYAADPGGDTLWMRYRDLMGTRREIQIRYARAGWELMHTGTLATGQTYQRIEFGRNIDWSDRLFMLIDYTQRERTADAPAFLHPTRYVIMPANQILNVERLDTLDADGFRWLTKQTLNVIFQDRLASSCTIGALASQPVGDASADRQVLHIDFEAADDDTSSADPNASSMAFWVGYTTYPMQIRVWLW